MKLEISQACRAHEELLRRYALDATGDLETRWQWLTAAHIVGQHHFGLHMRSHVAMLRLAISIRDWGEAAGQAFRLALVPLGHLLGRLPEGNIGRSTVSVFRPMPVDARSQQLIYGALGVSGAQ